MSFGRLSFEFLKAVCQKHGALLVWEAAYQEAAAQAASMDGDKKSQYQI